MTWLSRTPELFSPNACLDCDVTARITSATLDAPLGGESVELDATRVTSAECHAGHASRRIAHKLKRSTPGGKRALHHRLERARNVHQSDVVVLT